jgi:hypothetical protein
LNVSILAACLLAFIVVFLLLAVLAAVMRVITSAFPERRQGVDPAIVAAVTGTVAAVYPGARVVEIEEES